MTRVAPAHPSYDLPVPGTRTRPRALVPLFAAALLACGGPSKGEALESVKASVTEDGSCVLPRAIMALAKVQYASKAICVPREGAPEASACLEALAAAGLTSKKDASYMGAWPDEVAGASLAAVPAYERRARSQLYGACYALEGGLREGRFACADARAEKALRITKKDDDHADVTYARALKFKPELGAIEKACGAVTRPLVENSVALMKTPSGWAVGTGNADVVAADAGAR